MLKDKKNWFLEDVGLGSLERKRGGERMEKNIFSPHFQQLYVILCFFPYKRLVVQLLPDFFTTLTKNYFCLKL